MSVVLASSTHLRPQESLATLLDSGLAEITDISLDSALRQIIARCRLSMLLGSSERPKSGKNKESIKLSTVLDCQSVAGRIEIIRGAVAPV